MKSRADVEQELLEALQAEFDFGDDDSSHSAIRHAYIAESLASGRGFVDRVRKYGATDKGEPLRMPLWFCELLELIGDFRVPHVITSGCAQLGKTQSHTLLIVDVIVHGKMNVGWFYASRDSRDLNVPQQFYPVVGQWLAALERETKQRLIGPNDTQNSSRYQVDGATAIFSYTNTSKASPSRSGLAAAGGASVSFTANMVIKEERSQWLPGTADPVERRLDASLIPTRPVRDLGTPGAGQGIEVEIKRAHHNFYPHFTCNACGETSPLDPKGCLLRKFRRKGLSGKEQIVYLSESGRPVHWWHSDENRSIETAYFGCPECGEPITTEQRENAWYQCRKSGDRLRNYLDRGPQSSIRQKVAIILSPLCRTTTGNLASELIQGGIDAMRAEDWQQQALGHPSESTTTSVSLEMLEVAIGAAMPSYRVDRIVTIAGIDQGTNEDWLWIVEYHLPFGWERMSVPELHDRVVRVVRFGSDIIRTAIPDKLKEYAVDSGMIDNQPSRSDAAALCDLTCLQMGDQKADLPSAVKETIVTDGGKEFSCWDIRNDKFLKEVLMGFAIVSPDDDLPLYRLPDDWSKWVGIATERSPVRHLSGPSLDPETGAWKRGAGKVDDLYYAAMFAQAAFYLWLTTAPRDVVFRRGAERSSRDASWR
jgi:predicted RNA-binding Zn-ribbon protein involved in translation (DUF1610 family)